tara:strand:- start:28 stop:885 length:858 start_codon:yes stop_codon:yes gene_type:complete
LEATSVKKPFFISYILIGINVLLFVLMVFYQPGFSTDMTVNTLIDFGAKSNMHIVDGEYFRLVSSMFLHASLMHIVFNCLALRAFGRDIEIFFGKKKFLVIYFLSGIIGSLGSFLFSFRVGVGASGAIFGLLGANLYLLTLNPKLYKRIYGTDVLSLIGINLVIGFLVPNIDNAAHLAGLVGGYLAAWSVGLKNQSPFKAKHMIAQAVVLVLITFSLVWGVPNFKSSWVYDYYKADEMVQQLNYEKALDYLESGLEKDPGNESLQYSIDVIKDALDRNEAHIPPN